jgi:hypothetical protein
VKLTVILVRVRPENATALSVLDAFKELCWVHQRHDILAISLRLVVET